MLFFFLSKFRNFCQNFAEFSPNLTKFFRDFSKMQHFSEIPNYPAPIPPPIRNRRSFAGFWSRSVCLFLASSSARPQAAALRDHHPRPTAAPRRVVLLVRPFRGELTLTIGTTIAAERQRQTAPQGTQTDFPLKPSFPLPESKFDESCQ